MALRIGLLIGVLALLPGAAWAQVFSLELRSAYMTSHSEDVGGSTKFGDGLGMGGAVTYGYRDRALEFSLDVVPVNVDGERMDGRVMMMPLMVSGYFRFHPFGQRWFPYIGAGVGVVLTGFHESGDSNTKVDIADPLALQGALGFQFFVVKNWALTWQVRYLYARADVQLTESGSDEIDEEGLVLDTVVGTFGITKYF